MIVARHLQLDGAILGQPHPIVPAVVKTLRPVARSHNIVPINDPVQPVVGLFCGCSSASGRRFDLAGAVQRPARQRERNQHHHVKSANMHDREGIADGR